MMMMMMMMIIIIIRKKNEFTVAASATYGMLATNQETVTIFSYRTLIIKATPSRAPLSPPWLIEILSQSATDDETDE